MNEHSVIVKDLAKSFGDFLAVDRVSFEVRAGEIFGLLGANGAGKTTTIRMLAGLLRPSSGGGSVGGWDINTQFENIKKSIGYMSQRFSLYNDLTVKENLKFFGGVYGLGRAQVAARTAELDEALGLAEWLDRRTASLPLGFKQRLALGAAILHKPSIVFLDEPTSGVDPIARRRFWELINALAADGVTIIVTTHYMDEAEYCNRLCVMHVAKIVSLGSPAELKARHGAHSIEDVFIQLVRGA
ncbi:MAG: ATP-binding cassette domain-containing protein [Candidatus Krumholzibacteriia bacterium]